MQQIKKLLTSISLAAITLSHVAFSQEKIDTNENLTHAVETLNELESKGYSAKVISLVNSSIGWPTLVLKGKKNQGRVYLIEIATDKEGAYPLFRVYGPEQGSRCNLPDTVIDKIITVSSQRIQTNYFCFNDESDKGFTEVYVIKTEKGKAFVENELLSDRFIVINLDGKDLPFDLEGFLQKWNSLDEKAL
jgi:hypothetical protein